MSPLPSPARAAFVGALIAALVTLPGLGIGTLWDNSETAYGEVAREILLTHDWIVMHLNAIPWFIQPPLYFWVAALCVKAFGLHSFALRLPAALATIAMGMMTGYAVARQANTRTGIYASVILSSCLMQAVIGRLAIMDAMLDLFVALTIFWWFRALETGRDRYIVYGSIAAALGFLTKGPVAPVVALLVLVPYYVWNRRSEETFAPSLRAIVLSIVSFLAIITPWLAGIAVVSGTGALIELLGHYTFGRYTGVIENQSGPFWYYLPVLILGYFPWIAFLPMALVYAVRRLRDHGTDPGLARLWRLSIVWIVVPLLFFSFAKTKLPNYVALEFPALALLTALYFESVTRKGFSRSAVVSAATVPVFIGLIAIAIWMFSRDNRLGAGMEALKPDLLAMGLTIFLGSLLTAIMLLRGQLVSYALYALAASMMVAMDILAVGALPNAEAFKPVPKFAATIMANYKRGDAIAIENYRGSNALLFYTMPHVYVLNAHPDPIDGDANIPRNVICRNARVWVVGTKSHEQEEPSFGRNRREISQIGSGGLYLYYGAPCR